MPQTLCQQAYEPTNDWRDIVRIEEHNNGRTGKTDCCRDHEESRAPITNNPPYETQRNRECRRDVENPDPSTHHQELWHAGNGASPTEIRVFASVAIPIAMRRASLTR